jgi:hypothetical protein
LRGSHPFPATATASKVIPTSTAWLAS